MTPGRFVWTDEDEARLLVCEANALPSSERGRTLAKLRAALAELQRLQAPRGCTECGCWDTHRRECSRRATPPTPAATAEQRGLVCGDTVVDDGLTYRCDRARGHTGNCQRRYEWANQPQAKRRERGE